jgi:hypothetical protein
MAITGHACDGWVFWSVDIATENQPTEPQQEANANATEAASQTAAESAPAARPEDVPVTEPATAAPNKTSANKAFKRTPNQKGVPAGQTKWYCAECGESFLAPYGEIPSTCPQGHQA